MVNFLDLPTEIRLRIYQYLYSSNPSYLVLHLEISKRRIYEVPAHRGILGASRQCYEEVVDLHRESLAHLFVECDRFSVFKPTEQRYEAVAQYDRMFQSMFWRMPLDGQTRQLLADVRRLTVPAFISADSILNVSERYGLVSLDTIEFVSHGAPLLDQYACLPIDNANQENYSLQHAQYLAGPMRQLAGRSLRWRRTRQFRPILHVCCAGFAWNDMNVLARKVRRERPDNLFHILWTTRVRWTRESVKVNDDDPEVVYRSAGVGPFCDLIEFWCTIIEVHLQLYQSEIGKPADPLKDRLRDRRMSQPRQ